jgi:hypothetical protein
VRLEDDETALAEERARAHPSRLEPARRPAREIPDVHARAHELADHVEAGLPGFTLEAFQDGRSIADDCLPGSPYEPRASARAERLPRRLRRPRACHRGRDRGLVVDGKLREHGAARRVAHGSDRVTISVGMPIAIGVLRARMILARRPRRRCWPQPAGRGTAHRR